MRLGWLSGALRLAHSPTLVVFGALRWDNSLASGVSGGDELVSGFRSAVFGICLSKGIDGTYH